MRTINVHADRDYPVHIGRGLLEGLASSQLLPAFERALLIHPQDLTEAAARLAGELSTRGQVTTFAHPNGEAGKEVSVLAKAWEAAAAARIGRRDLVISMGGGATTDLAGFVAATWLRGVEVVHLPTTLLAMVDAAVGGKTGINTPAGKNLAGAFYSPAAVIADTAMLASLPEPEFVSALAEVIKCGFIRDERILELVEENSPVRPGDQQLVGELIERALRVKAAVVSADLREAGDREILNYGHTLAHAVEKLTGYQVRHGEAVAIGCVFASHVALQRGYSAPDWARRQQAVLAANGLPTRWNWASADEVVAAMHADKKVRSQQIRMVLTSQPGATRVEPISDEEVRRALQEMGVCE